MLQRALWRKAERAPRRRSLDSPAGVRDLVAMLILAHRGASADAPENTLPAFLEAARQGADGIELDAMACGSGEVVVCHDESLLRLAGLNWEVVRTPLWKLRRADVGRQLGYASAGVPLLEEVIAALPSHFVLNLELKCETADDFGLCAGVVEVIRRLGVVERTVISSFNPLCLWRVGALEPGVRRGLLIDPDKSFFLQNALVAPLVCTHSVHAYHRQITPARVAAWRARGWEVAAWTVDEPADAQALRELGVRYCITNRPGALKAALKR